VKVKTKVWFGRARAAGWVVLGLASFALSIQDSVALVWAASVYANVVSDLAVAEAADDALVMEELKAIRADQAEILALLRERGYAGPREA
jgi:hypothetical protein